MADVARADLIERGLITTAELAKKMVEVGARVATTTWAGCRRTGSDTSRARLQHWERRVDALVMLLSGSREPKRRITVDELRKSIERLRRDAYEELNYYDRWVSAIAQTLIQRGVITSEELALKMAEVENVS